MMNTQVIEALSTRIELKGIQGKVSSLLDELLKPRRRQTHLTAAEVRACFQKYERTHKLQRSLSELLEAMRDE